MYPTEPLIPLPVPRCIIDTICLDEEIQLERELIEDELRPIDAAWAAYEPRATWPQPLPMQIWLPKAYWGLTALQRMFLQHIVFSGEIGSLEAVGLANRLSFATARELYRKKWGSYPVSKVIEAANLISELRAVA
jgi:hypothetical protein